MSTEGSTTVTDGHTEWYRDAIFYEIPVRSYFDSNGDGVGDLRGLTAKLDYIQDLGVTCLWLLPFFPSPLRDDGYDVTDYRAIHPSLGTIDDFRQLLVEAKKRGLRIAAEMVINHTSIEHPWFQAARSAPAGSAQREFYVWSDVPPAAGDVPTSANGHAQWTWDEQAHAYYWHRFASHQPDLNFRNPEVRDEMLKVLRFWANLGVDGLCLNGASYLVERDGTTGEHLPETHDILRYFRQQLASEYPSLMLQAGLNAWPSESRSYFGESDECHMVPQLALAQRMFLALHQEDRAPVEELLRNTPELPNGCQWVTLLRNHDELTLELASDEERDYLFREYAYDSSMRHHAGILRRLAPLVSNDRRRMELLFSLLFSLPGSPMIYYGDELGMGDNVFLGGRAGIRTPMQWSTDRNAGFSTTDFARLFAPPVVDPVFGFESVNVETQRRTSTSLYRWVRRLISLRKNSLPLSRGTLEWLEPDNQKVVAFVRQMPGQSKTDDSVLVVANLSRTSQPTELDLSAYEGLTPVELFGRTPFPVIDRSRYRVTLGPHSFLWFRLQKSVEPVASRLAWIRTESVEQVPVIEVPAEFSQLFVSPTRETLERDVFPNFLRSQRWFGGKARRIESIEVADYGAVTGVKHAYFVLLKVMFGGGASDLYFVPLAVAEGAEAKRLYESMRPWVVALLRCTESDAVLYDALANDKMCNAVLNAMGMETSFSTEAGRINSIATHSFKGLRGEGENDLPVVRGPATSSNSLIFFGRRLLFKLFRRLEEGTNPDFEVGRFLTEGQVFDRLPQVAGTLEYFKSDGSGPFTLGILQAMVKNQGDGWGHVIEELGRYYERAAGRMLGPDAPQPDPRPLHALIDAVPPPAVLETISGYLHSAGILGQRTAQMHKAFASDASLSAFAPEPIDVEDVQSLQAEMKFQAGEAFSALAKNLDRLPPAISHQARPLLDSGEAALEKLTRTATQVPQAMKTRIHGDYHLGQVLWADNDYIILDFEGEPTRTVNERRAKFSPIRDVAGMLRSFHYAAYAGLFTFTQDRPDDFANLAPWAEMWQQWVSAAFVHQYLLTAGPAVFIPSDRREFAFLLDSYMLAKALYELVYELNNRPDWVRIPIGGVWRLLELHLDQSQPELQGSTP